MKPFANESVLELRRPPVRDALAGALAELDARGPVRVPVWVGRERRQGDELVSTDPGAPDRVVGYRAKKNSLPVAPGAPARRRNAPRCC